MEQQIDVSLSPSLLSLRINKYSLKKKEKIWCLFRMDCYSAIIKNKSQINLAICDNMDGCRGYYAKLNKSDRERQIPYNLTYMWDLIKNETKE